MDVFPDTETVVVGTTAAPVTAATDFGGASCGDRAHGVRDDPDWHSDRHRDDARTDDREVITEELPGVP